MRTFDLAPLYRSTVGFDRLFSMLDNVAGYDNARAGLSALQHRAHRRKRLSHFDSCRWLRPDPKFRLSRRENTPDDQG